MIIELKIWADIHSTGLFNMIGKQIFKEETSICSDTWKQLQEWVDKYDDIALMETEERIANNELINQLDREGYKLLLKIKEESPYDKNCNLIRYKYYSEGLLKYLHRADIFFEEE